LNKNAFFKQKPKAVIFSGLFFVPIFINTTAKYPILSAMEGRIEDLFASLFLPLRQEDASGKLPGTGFQQ